MLRALQADAQRRDCAWLASLPPLPGTNGAAITALLHTFVQQRCARLPCMAQPCMCVAGRLLEQKGSLRSFAEAVQSGRVTPLSCCNPLLLAGWHGAGLQRVMLTALSSSGTSCNAS